MNASHSRIGSRVGSCWHRFLTRVKEGDFCEEEVADLEETKSWTVLESADGFRPMGQKNMLW